MKHPVLLGPTTLLGLIVLSVGSDQALGQWLTFTEESGSRLVLTQTSTNDTEEKDMASADLDHDGDTDLLVVRKNPFSNPGPRVDILLMNENGVLTDRTAALAPGFIAAPTDARDVVIADVNNDGWEDVLIVSTFNDPPRLYINRGLDGAMQWMGLADETSARMPALGTLLNQSPGPLFCGGAAADIDGDNDLDLYFSNYNRADDGPTEDVLMINNGTGVFTIETIARLGDRRFSAFNTGSIFADADNDGDMDIVKISTLYSVAPWNNAGVFVVFNNGSGIFTDSAFQTLNTNQPYMVAAANLNADGYPDLYTVQDGDDRIHLGQDAGGGAVSYLSATVSSPRTSDFGGNTKFADLDRDGDLDVGVGPVDVDIANCDGFFGGEFSLMRNDGTGVLVDPYPTDTNIHQRPHDYEFMDVNNDGALDIVMGLCNGWSVLIQDFTPPCSADLTGDGAVDGADLAQLLAAWGGTGAADLNNDGGVNGSDLAVLLAAWGPCP